jgi:putative N6-adenine-specific DNA methylase
LILDPRTLPLETLSNVAILGSDRDDGAVHAAASNAERAGVGNLIDIQRAALACNPWLDNPSTAPDSSLVITNPPFGKRIKGKRSENPLLPLYQTFGSRIVQLGENASVTVLTCDVNLARRMGLSMKVIFSTHHGGIEVAAMSTIPKPSTKKD